MLLTCFVGVTVVLREGVEGVDLDPRPGGLCYWERKGDKVVEATEAAERGSIRLPFAEEGPAWLSAASPPRNQAVTKPRRPS